MEHENDCDTDCYWCTRYKNQRRGTETRELGNKRTSEDNANNTIIKIS